uniref:Retrovirus-related Pol polyprotein from transposon TNT 1-94 n=1 Tax=Tanacetum cinerariifolium TaxID=118510 RepID=A0A6L2LTN4_TANCI|nr:retrovirus-related Pol polyprotein from transposon TNT 1-94 [Tanacetum cinerariifolium]
MAKSREELYISNISKTANVSKPISIPNEEFSDDTTPSYIHNWSSSAHQELHKIVKDETFPIVNQVDARVQNFEIQFLKEAAKFVGDFKSLAKEADESLAKHKALELEIKRLLRAVVSQDIMSVVQNNSVGETSNLQTELERKSKDTSCVQDTLNPLSQKLENENVELEFQVLNYAKENTHLKTTYMNMFKSISVTRTQTKTIINSLQNKLHGTIYENAKLRAQLFDKVSDQKDTACGTSVNTKFANQSILGKPPKVGKTHALSKPVTSNSIPTPQGSKVVKNIKVIAPRMFRINPFKPSREEKHVPNKVRASFRTNPITVSQASVITKKIVIQICLWCVDSGCSKHMTGNLNLLINFVWKFLGTVCFGNDHVAAILGFSDLQWGNILITRSKDEAPKVIKTFLKRISILLQSPSSISINGKQTPQQNGVVERRNWTLVEAAKTMLIFSRAPLFLWAEAIATACFTQNRSIIYHRFNQTPYELINGRKPDISFLHVFRALCYPKNEREDIRKLGAKGDIGFFIGYSADSFVFKVFNRRTKKIMETMNVSFDELLMKLLIIGSTTLD